MSADARALELTRAAAAAARDKLAQDVLAFDVSEQLALTDVFLLCSASNDRQVKAICDEVELQVHEAGGPKPKRIEGLEDRLWVLMDYGDVVVHVFQQEQREFYDLERLWARAPRAELPEPFQSQARRQKTGTEGH